MRSCILEETGSLIIFSEKARGKVSTQCIFLTDLQPFPFKMTPLKWMGPFLISEQGSLNPSTKLHGTKMSLIIWERRPLFFFFLLVGGHFGSVSASVHLLLEETILVFWAACFRPQTPVLPQKPLNPSRKINVSITNSAAWQLWTIPLCQITISRSL